MRRRKQCGHTLRQLHAQAREHHVEDRYRPAFACPTAKSNQAESPWTCVRPRFRERGGSYIFGHKHEERVARLIKCFAKPVADLLASVRCLRSKSAIRRKTEPRIEMCLEAVPLARVIWTPG